MLVFFLFYVFTLTQKNRNTCKLRKVRRARRHTEYRLFYERMLHRFDRHFQMRRRNFFNMFFLFLQKTNEKYKCKKCRMNVALWRFLTWHTILWMDLENWSCVERMRLQIQSKTKALEWYWENTRKMEKLKMDLESSHWNGQKSESKHSIYYYK